MTENEKKIEEIREEVETCPTSVDGAMWQINCNFLLSEIDRLKGELEDERKANYADDFNYAHECKKELQKENDRLKIALECRQQYIEALKAQRKENKCL